MTKTILAVAVLIAGSAALAQTTQVAPAAPAPVATPAPVAHPMRDKAMTRTEVVANVRDHFAQMDTNKDGSLTADEAMAGRGKFLERHEFRKGGDPNAAFDRLDANKDGSISRTEFAKAHEQRMERRMVMREEREKARDGVKDGKGARRAMRKNGMSGMSSHMIGMADSNKDGRITLAEAETLALQHFDQMDTNKDGQVTREERRAARSMMMKSTEER